MKTEDKRKQLLEFVGELKSHGFKVYASENLTTYCHFVKGDKIGYVERGDFGFNFSTVHKPCTECGTGFGMERETYNPKVQMAEDCLLLAPHWASNRDLQAVKKYKNWEDYVNATENRWSPQVEL